SGPVAGDSPAEQRGEVVVADASRRIAEHDRVQRVARAAHRRDLAPAGRTGMSRLDADQAREAAAQIVPGVETAAGRDPVLLPRDGGADLGVVHRGLREL